MILTADEAIPFALEAFSDLGEVRTFPGRKIGPAEVRDAEILIVRSVTRVNADLLEGSSVRFVGSATIGMDHVDEEYLRARGIPCSNAAGCNATAVADYVLAALMVVAGRRGWTLAEKSLAIIGVGNVGSQVQKRARALNMEVALCDPPLKDRTGDAKYRSLRDVLRADILTFHVPLTRGGLYPTWHMIDGALLAGLAPGKVLINTARGPVFDGAEVKSALDSGRIAGAVLDVWENEPGIDLSLLDRLDIGSAHIAGYSLDGKIRATEMIYRQLCAFLKTPETWNSRRLYPETIRIRPLPGSDGKAALRSAVLQAYNILQDDANLRALKSLEAGEAGAGFDRLRNRYRYRPEFTHHFVELDGELAALAAAFSGLGFQVPKEEAKPGGVRHAP